MGLRGTGERAMLFRKNRRTTAAAWPRSLKVLYGLAIVLCALWAGIAYALYPDVWPPPSGSGVFRRLPPLAGRFGVFRWWPMYAFLGIVAGLGLWLNRRRSFVIPCILLGVIVGDIVNFVFNPSSILHIVRGVHVIDRPFAYWATGAYMFWGIGIGFVFGVILDRHRTEPLSLPRPRLTQPLTGAVVLSLFAVLFGGLGLLPRVTPGGPFIHITTNVLPAIAAIVAIRIGLVKLREKQLAATLVSLVLISICTLALCHVVLDVHSYWTRPAARGSLFGL